MQEIDTAEQWADAINAWQAWLSTYMRPATVRLRTYQLRHIAERHLDVSPWRLSTDNLARYMCAYSWAPETLKGCRSALRSFYQWAVVTGRTGRNPAAQLASIRVPDALPRPAPDDAFRRALEVSNDRTRLMLLLARRAGLRAGEIAALRLRDIDQLYHQLIVPGKGGKARRVPIANDLRAELYAELARRRAGEHGTGYRYHAGLRRWLFPGSRGGPIQAGSVSRVLSRVLGELTAHQLRHAFATAAHAGTHDLLAVQQLLGHSRLETTVRYTRLTNDALWSAVHAAAS